MGSNATQSLAVADPQGGVAALIAGAIRRLERIPHSLIALLGRFSISAVFWTSGQTKIDGLAINFITGEFKLGWPRLSDNAITLFKEEYRLPFLSPELAAPLAATAEHVFPILILFGLATRFSALALLGMTLVIEIFVYPGAYATHGTWAAVLLYLIARGPGAVSVDHWLFRRQARRAAQ
jgi:putative oxidoreductase